MPLEEQLKDIIDRINEQVSYDPEWRDATLRVCYILQAYRYCLQLDDADHTFARLGSQPEPSRLKLQLLRAISELSTEAIADVVGDGE